MIKDHIKSRACSKHLRMLLEKTILKGHEKEMITIEELKIIVKEIDF